MLHSYTRFHQYQQGHPPDDLLPITTLLGGQYDVSISYTQLTSLINELCRCHLFRWEGLIKPSASFPKWVDIIKFVLPRFNIK